MEVIFYVKVKKENRHSAIPVPLRKLLIFNCVCWPGDVYKRQEYAPMTSLTSLALSPQGVIGAGYSVDENYIADGQLWCAVQTRCV